MPLKCCPCCGSHAMTRFHITFPDRLGASKQSVYLEPKLCSVDCICRLSPSLPSRETALQIVFAGANVPNSPMQLGISRPLPVTSTKGTFPDNKAHRNFFLLSPYFPPPFIQHLLFCTALVQASTTWDSIWTLLAITFYHNLHSLQSSQDAWLC